jgi:hypothetical protein
MASFIIPCHSSRNSSGDCVFDNVTCKLDYYFMNGNLRSHICIFVVCYHVFS